MANTTPVCVDSVLVTNSFENGPDASQLVECSNCRYHVKEGLLKDEVIERLHCLIAELRQTESHILPSGDNIPLCAAIQLASSHTQTASCLNTLEFSQQFSTFKSISEAATQCDRVRKTIIKLYEEKASLEAQLLESRQQHISSMTEIESLSHDLASSRDMSAKARTILQQSFQIDDDDLSHLAESCVLRLKDLSTRPATDEKASQSDAASSELLTQNPSKDENDNSSKGNQLNRMKKRIKQLQKQLQTLQNDAKAKTETLQAELDQTLEVLCNCKGLLVSQEVKNQEESVTVIGSQVVDLLNRRLAEKEELQKEVRHLKEFCGSLESQLQDAKLLSSPTKPSQGHKGVQCSEEKVHLQNLQKEIQDLQSARTDFNEAWNVLRECEYILNPECGQGQDESVTSVSSRVKDTLTRRLAQNEDIQRRHEQLQQDYHCLERQLEDLRHSSQPPTQVHKAVQCSKGKAHLHSLQKEVQDLQIARTDLVEAWKVLRDCESLLVPEGPKEDENLTSVGSRVKELLTRQLTERQDIQRSFEQLTQDYTYLESHLEDLRSSSKPPLLDHKAIQCSKGKAHLQSLQKEIQDLQGERKELTASLKVLRECEFILVPEGDQEQEENVMSLSSRVKDLLTNRLAEKEEIQRSYDQLRQDYASLEIQLEDALRSSQPPTQVHKAVQCSKGKAHLHSLQKEVQDLKMTKTDLIEAWKVLRECESLLVPEGRQEDESLTSVGSRVKELLTRQLTERQDIQRSFEQLTQDYTSLENQLEDLRSSSKPPLQDHKAIQCSKGKAHLHNLQKEVGDLQSARDECEKRLASSNAILGMCSDALAPVLQEHGGDEDRDVVEKVMFVVQRLSDLHQEKMKLASVTRHEWSGGPCEDIDYEKEKISQQLTKAKLDLLKAKRLCKKEQDKYAALCQKWTIAQEEREAILFFLSQWLLNVNAEETARESLLEVAEQIKTAVTQREAHLQTVCCDLEKRLSQVHNPLKSSQGVQTEPMPMQMKYEKALRRLKHLEEDLDSWRRNLSRFLEDISGWKQQVFELGTPLLDSSLTDSQQQELRLLHQEVRSCYDEVWQARRTLCNVELPKELLLEWRTLPLTALVSKVVHAIVSRESVTTLEMKVCELEDQTRCLKKAVDRWEGSTSRRNHNLAAAVVPNTCRESNGLHKAEHHILSLLEQANKLLGLANWEREDLQRKCSPVNCLDQVPPRLMTNSVKPGCRSQHQTVARDGEHS